ncbi:MAG: hypothetical protein KF830_12990 [Planctomycetes bacterium]|nr:hypothetical protein [Planctomycetota bacterium]
MPRRCLPLLVLAVACATSGPDGPPGAWPAAPFVVRRLPPGTALRTGVVDGLPDEPLWRAAAVWWQEAIRQTTAFELRDELPAHTLLPTLLLAADLQQRTLTASWLGDDLPQVLAGASFADGDLPAAIDRLAYTTRTALGERAAQPVAVGAGLSRRPDVVLALDDAARLARDGGIAAARRLLLDARRGDGASPAVLGALAAVEVLLGDAGAAERLCLEALGYTARLLPTIEHRLGRTLLLARASQRPDRAAARDRELLALGEAIVRERPYDLHGQLTLALAQTFTGDFAGARPRLERLRRAMPEDPIVAYHLGWACLGTGDGAAASAQFDAAADRLPLAWVAVPRAIARFTAGDDQGLTELLADLADEARRGRGPLHQVRRMQAAQALLAGRLDMARRHLLEDMHWLAQNPSAVEHRIGEFAEQGAVLVRLGGGAELQPILAVLQEQKPSAAIAEACAFLSGMVQVAETRSRATALEARLARGGDSAWSQLLAAFAHELRGETQDMLAALARAARLSDSALTKALLARGLRAAGRTEEAANLQAAVRRELTAVHLRQPPTHPLLGPELAFAYLAD